MDTHYSRKSLLIAGLVLAAVAFGIGFLVRGGDENPTSTDTPSPSASVLSTARPRVSATPAYSPKSYIIRIAQDGPVPKSLTVHTGDSVSIINATDTLYWPASDPHPSHTNCPGFDAKRGLQRGDGYTLTFSTKKTCGYHNHLDPANAAQRGTIIVQ
ncbi:MAG: hypothetical protein IT405_01190 [Candidatus Yanofskybacteria bacterium]|nr:hypothetical protein [Candidatus Yanofskybacteria bacterium]